MIDSPHTRPVVVACDDWNDSIGAHLAASAYDVRAVTSPVMALDVAQRSQADAVVLRWGLRGSWARELSRVTSALVTLPREVSIVAVGAREEVCGWADAALGAGAAEIVEWPADAMRVTCAVRHAIERRALRDENRRLRAVARWTAFERPTAWIAESAAARTLLDSVARAAASSAPVVVFGETGTGRRSAARTIHDAGRAESGPLIECDAEWISPDGELLARPGTPSLTLDHVGGGTLVVRGDRLGPTHRQPLLASAARRDVRLIAVVETPAGWRDAIGTVAELEVPPLRARRADIHLLAHHFLCEYAARLARPLDGFECDALEHLAAAHWPGNVRELQQAIWRAALTARRPLVGLDDLGGAAGARPERAEELPIEDIERMLVTKALQAARGNVSAASRKIGFSRSSFYRRLHEYGLCKQGA